MSAHNLSRDTALKIALAARVLPGITVSSLLEILHARLEGELSSDSLKQVTVTDLKTSFASVDGEEDGEDIGIGLDAMKEAVRLLWGDDLDKDLPSIESFDEEDVKCIRVAVASNSGEQLNGHFGSCIRFLVYQMSSTQLKLIDIRSALEADFSDDKNLFRANIIQDCDVGYFVSVGGPAAAKVIRAGIYPIKEINGGEARTVLARLQEVMADKPPPWLAKLLGDSEAERVRCSTLQESS